MIECGEGLGFTREPRDTVGVVGKRLGQNLDRDVAIQLRIARAIHLAHSAFAKLRDDFIGPEFHAYLHRVSLASARPRRSSRVISPRTKAGPPAPRRLTISYVPTRAPLDRLMTTSEL